MTFVISPKGNNSENADIPKGNSGEEKIKDSDKIKVSDKVDVPIGDSLEESDTVTDKNHVSEKLAVKPGRKRCRRGVTEESKIPKQMKEVPNLKTKEEMPDTRNTQRPEKDKPIDVKYKTSNSTVIFTRKRNTENMKSPFPQKERAKSKGFVADTSVSGNAKTHNRQFEKVTGK